MSETDFKELFRVNTRPIAASWSTRRKDWRSGRSIWALMVSQIGLRSFSKHSVRLTSAMDTDNPWLPLQWSGLWCGSFSEERVDLFRPPFGKD